MILGSMLVAFFSSAVLWAQEPSVQLPPDLARVLSDYEGAWGARDASALAGLFAEDGFVLPSGRPPVRGREAIARYYQGHGGPLYLRAIAYSTEGSVGYILGAYRGEENGADDGKFTLTLKKDPSGRWWIFSDMDNRNRPAR
jgi:ketosteroid isomerase-like protein